MPSFTVTTSATSASQLLTTSTSAVFIGGVQGGASISIEASPDNTNWAPLLPAREVACAGKAENSIGVMQCSLPSGWYVRVVSKTAGPTTNVLVSIA